MKPPPDPKPFWVPRTDIFIAQSGHLTVEIELSGMQSGDLEITTEAGKLIIKGSRHGKGIPIAQAVLVNDIPAGPFETVLGFPPGFDLPRASSAYLNGLLRISVPPLTPPRVK